MFALEEGGGPSVVHAGTDEPASGTVGDDLGPVGNVWGSVDSPRRRRYSSSSVSSTVATVSSVTTR